VHRRRWLVCPLRQVNLQNLRTVGIPCLYKSYKIQQPHLRCVSFRAPVDRPVEGQLTLPRDADMRFSGCPQIGAKATSFVSARRGIVTRPELELDFASIGGRLLSGCDPTGSGDALPGFGDLCETELLVEAGFSPAGAIKIATPKGAVCLGKDSRSARSRLDRTRTRWSSSHAPPDIMCTGEWEWLRCPRKCPSTKGCRRKY
jgi:hypothetical protein